MTNNSNDDLNVVTAASTLLIPAWWGWKKSRFMFASSTVS